MFWIGKSDNPRIRDGFKQGWKNRVIKTRQFVQWAGLWVVIMLGGLMILVIGLDALFMLVFIVLILKLVRSRRLELPQGFPYSDLNAARLPFRHDRTTHNVSDFSVRAKPFL